MRATACGRRLDSRLTLAARADPNFKSLIFMRYIYFPGGPTDKAEGRADTTTDAAHYLLYVDARHHVRGRPGRAEAHA